MNWPTARLGEVALVQGGRTPKGLDRWLADNPRSDRDIPFFKVGDMNAGPTLRKARTLLARADLDELRLSAVAVGSVVFPKAGGAIATNKKRSVEMEGPVDLNCMAVTPGPYLDERFLRLWFESFDLTTIADGSILPQISKRSASDLKLPLPSLDEQRRIVDLLEDHLSRLDAGRRRLDAMAQVVLAICRDGNFRPLAGVTAIQGGIQKQQKRAPKDNAFPFLRVANVTARGLDLADVHNVELFAGELDRLRLRIGDLLVVEGNGSASQIGRAALWDGSIEDCVHQNHLIRVRPLDDLLPTYLEAAWNSPQNRATLTDIASSSSGLHTLSVSKLKALSIPVPSIDRQRELVASVDQVREAKARLATASSKAAARSGALRRALLAAAFSGRLTEDCPEPDPAQEAVG